MGKKIIFKSVFVIIVLLILFYFFRGAVLEFIFEKSFSRVFDQKVTIEKVEVDSKFTQFYIQNFKIINPNKNNGFVIVDAPSIYMDFNFGKYLLTGKLWFSKMIVNMRELNLVRYSDGVLNVAKFQRSNPVDKSVTHKSPKRSLFYVKELILSISQVTYVDEMPTISKKMSVDFNIRGYTFYDIGNLSELVRIVLSQVFYSKTLGYLGDALGVNFYPVSKHLWNTWEAGQNTLQTTNTAIQMTPVRPVTSFFKEYYNKGKELVKKGAKSDTNTTQEAPNSLESGKKIRENN